MTPSRPVLLAWALLAVLTSLPYLLAWLEPPPGTAFVGFFYYIDDHYNYLSFAQQAEDGAFFFRNKLASEPHAPVLVNLEWWLVGRLSALLGRHPALAYRLVGLAAALAFLAGLDLWLRRLGLPEPHRLPALLLVATGGGLGGILFTVLDRTRWYLDLFTGLFPFVGLLLNPHFTAGTTLLLWALWAHLDARTSGGRIRAALLGTVVGLVRPYDLMLLVVIRALAVLLSEPGRLWVRSLLPLTNLAPVAAYNFWVFYRFPAFAFYANAPYSFPGLADFALALGPAAFLALTAVGSHASDGAARQARLHLGSWALLATIVIAVRPVHFSLQFLVGLGLPLLALGAVGLSRFRPGVLLLAALPLGSTALAALRLVCSPSSHWFVTADRLAVAHLLRGSCRPGDLVLAPADIGLYAAGLTACRAYVSHPIGPDYVRREAEVRAFYQPGDPSARGVFLDRQCVTRVVLPDDPGPRPRDWLGEETPFRRIGRTGAISLYARDGRPPCPAP